MKPTNQDEYKAENDRLSEMLVQFIREGNKEAINKVRAELNRNSLLFDKFQNSYELEVEIISAGCCDECDKIDASIVEMEAELVNQTLPQKNCIRPNTGCICCYTAKIKFDENDDPVMRRT
ncbi:MAG: hypothetical protein H7Y01_09140 [Ferruginibacter sp.]|nr:hypothetical protein [Chitinophagaceae bacterium]